MSLVIDGSQQCHLIVRFGDKKKTDVLSYPPLPPLFLIIRLPCLLRLLFHLSLLHSRLLFSCQPGMFSLCSDNSFCPTFCVIMVMQVDYEACRKLCMYSNLKQKKKLRSSVSSLAQTDLNSQHSTLNTHLPTPTQASSLCWHSNYYSCVFNFAKYLTKISFLEKNVMKLGQSSVEIYHKT